MRAEIGRGAGSGNVRDRGEGVKEARGQELEERAAQEKEAREKCACVCSHTDRSACWGQVAAQGFPVPAKQQYPCATTALLLSLKRVYCEKRSSERSCGSR